MENKKIYPCIKCPHDTFRNCIAPHLKRWGYKDKTNSYLWFNPSSFIATWFNGRRLVVFYTDAMHNEQDGQYLCSSIGEFLIAAKAIAIEKGQFKKEEMIEEKIDNKNTIPTLSEARKKFRELTKLYSVEELSKPDPPRSWEEYLEQNPVADEHTAEVKKKIAALEKLVLLRDKWGDGWAPVEDEIHYDIQRYCDGLAIEEHSFLQVCLSFPTRVMAEDFLNTFRDLIEEAGDLI